MSEELTKDNFLKKSYKKIITSVKGLGLFKEFVIVALLFSIILIGFYDSILPLFINIESNFLNNLLSITPIFILILILTIAFCSHFKIFGKDASYNFNHKIINFHKYKKVIASKIEAYKNKLFKLQNLYNQNDLIRVKIRNNISNLRNKNINLEKMSENKLDDCVQLNEKNNMVIKKFLDRAIDNIDEISYKGNQLYKKALAYKREQYNLAKQRMAIDEQNRTAGELFEQNRIKNIQDEKARRQKAADNERLRRIEIVKKRKLAWLQPQEKNLRWRAENEKVVFFRHRSYDVCAAQTPKHYWPDWGHRNRYQHCGHDEVSAVTVPTYAILDIWQHTGRHGTHRRLIGNRHSSRHYPIGWFYANGMNDQISSSEVKIDTKKLDADIAVLHNKPLSHFGNIFVEGPDGLKAAPGYDKNSIK